MNLGRLRDFQGSLCPFGLAFLAPDMVAALIVQLKWLENEISLYDIPHCSPCSLYTLLHSLLSSTQTHGSLSLCICMFLCLKHCVKFI